MQLEILKGNMARVVSCQGLEERETFMSGCGLDAILDDLRIDVFLWEFDAGKVTLQLVWTVARVVGIFQRELREACWLVLKRHGLRKIRTCEANERLPSDSR